MCVKASASVITRLSFCKTASLGQKYLSLLTSALQTEMLILCWGLSPFGTRDDPFGPFSPWVISPYLHQPFVGERGRTFLPHLPCPGGLGSSPGLAQLPAVSLSPAGLTCDSHHATNHVQSCCWLQSWGNTLNSLWHTES